MSFTSYFVNKSNLVTNKYSKIMNNLSKEYESKNIKTETEYLYYVNLATKSFMDNLDKPMFEYKEAKSTPISEHFNDMINTAIDDIDVLLNEAMYVGENANSINNEIYLYVSMFNNTTNQLMKNISHMEETIKSVQENKHYVFSDTFNDTSKSVPQPLEEACRIDNVNGYITIGTNIERDYTSSLLFKIDDESNGFPGNTHEVEILNNGIRYVGDNEPYINMYNITDGQESTWFEYEAYEIDNETYLNCNGYGFDYKEGKSWLLDGDKQKLKLKLVAYFDEPKMSNWISISPFLHMNKNSNLPIVESVVISDGVFQTQKIDIKKEFKDTLTVTFEPQEIREIIINIEQRFGYQTDIGHYYTLKIDKDTSVFDIVNKKDFRRINVFKPTIEVLGIKYDPSKKEYIQPKYTHKKNLVANTNIIRNELFTLPENKNEYEYNDIEMLKASRYAIAIKSMGVHNYIFNEKGIYCSTTYETKDNIVSVELEADDNIPENFKAADPSKQYNPSQYLKYELSFDGGNEWYEVNPRHRVQYGPCCININSDVLPSMRSPRNIRYIDRVLDTKSISVRITMNRPDGYIYDSPIVNGYKLNVLTEVDDFDNFGVTKE